MRIATIFVVAVLLSGCEPPKPQPDGTPQSYSRLRTELHGGHEYVIERFDGHFIHSPACPCRHLEEPTNGQ